MSVISVRMNESEEKMLKKLSQRYNEDKSTLIKHSLRNLYEDTLDLDEIDQFEIKESQGSAEFVSFDEIISKLGHK